MVTQDHRRPVADGADQARPLVGVHGDALEVMVGEFAVELRRIEVAHRQARLRARHRHARGGVRMHHAMRARDRVVDGRVDGEAGGVDRPARCTDPVPREVDLHQVGGADLAVEQTEGIDQEMLPRTRQTKRDVVVDELDPAEPREDAIAGGELHACLPFLRGESRCLRRRRARAHARRGAYSGCIAGSAPGRAHAFPPEVATRPPPKGGRAPWGGPAALMRFPPKSLRDLPPKGGRAPWGGPAALMPSTPRPRSYSSSDRCRRSRTPPRRRRALQPGQAACR